MNALILDGHLKSALATVRSLGRVGVILSVGAERETAMSLHSKYTHRRFVYPSPYTHQEKFIQCIQAEAQRLGGKPVVYAFSDATYLSLYTHREALAEYVTIIFPDSKSVEIAYDKAATYSLARVSGIPTITTYLPESVDEVKIIGESLSYPVVLKPRKSVTWHNGIGVFGSVVFIQNNSELQDTFSTLKEKIGESPLIQNLLLGEEYGVEMLAQNGTVYAMVTHHRNRSLSPTGGASVLKETLFTGDLRHTLETYAQTLVTKLMWTGPIMIEFKVDSDTREPHLMEINGRFWGSLPLSIYAGVDIPYEYFKVVQGGVIPSEILTGREGVISNHFLGDVKNLTSVLFAQDPMRKILYPKRTTAIRDFCVLPLGTKGDVWSIHDPKPAGMEIIDTIKKKLWTPKNNEHM